jgi:hypothetical protein
MASAASTLGCIATSLGFTRPGIEHLPQRAGKDTHRYLAVVVSRHLLQFVRQTLQDHLRRERAPDPRHVVGRVTQAPESLHEFVFRLRRIKLFQAKRECVHAAIVGSELRDNSRSATSWTRAGRPKPSARASR